MIFKAELELIERYNKSIHQMHKLKQNQQDFDTSERIYILYDLHKANAS